MMRSILPSLICLTLVYCACAGGNPVKNPDFAQVDARDANAPAEWRLPDGGAWRRTLAGPTGEMCLFYDAGTAASGPATQRVQSLKPGVTWELRVKLKTGGGLMPVVTVSSATDESELGRALARRSGLWQTVGLRFKPTEADMIIKLYADDKHRSGAEANAGNVRVALVELAKVADAGPGEQLPDLGENIALGTSYTMTMGGRYELCSDPDDKTQLTDGVYTEGASSIWAQKSTVGWRTSKPAQVTIDLGKAQPIRGMSLGSAAGVSGVTWPASVIVHVSDDGKNWHYIGDVVKLHNQRAPLPPYGQYSVRRIWTDQLRTHGRYMHVAMEPGGPFVFCDEIEVCRGEDAWLAEATRGESVTDPGQHVSDRIATRQIRRHFEEVLTMVSDTIVEAPEAEHAGLRTRAGELAKAIDRMPLPSLANFRAVLPMAKVERDIFALQAKVWRAQGKPTLRVWRQNRWDPLSPVAEPPDDTAPALRVDMMSNEFRADVLNFTNASEEALDLRLRVVGLPGGDNPDYLTVQRVEHVGTPHMQIGSVAAALVDAERAGGDWLVDAPTGMARQVWLAVNRPDIPAGEHTGALEIRTEGRTISVPLTLRIWPLRFPDRTTLCVGGFDYTNMHGNYQGLTEVNRGAFIKHMAEHFVNAPWARGSKAMPAGKYDAAGKMTEKPSTDNFDAWQANWPDAKMYMVFLAQRSGTPFDGDMPGSDRFNTKVGNWARFWADHMVKLGLEASQLVLHVLDEPHSREQYDASVAWFRAIDAGAPEIVTWTDPGPREPNDGVLEMYQAADILCPARQQHLRRPQWYRDLLLEAQARGTDVWFYSCSGPARGLDPFSYYLLQAWHGFAIGAKGSAFWCFSSNGGASCWNEYIGKTSLGPYSPVYLDDTSVTAAKYMEAIRESAEDFEYLTMLRNSIEKLEAAGVPTAKLAAAKQLLATAPARVMASEDGANNWRWDKPKDRTVQDTVRVEILRTLTELAKM